MFKIIAVGLVLVAGITAIQHQESNILINIDFDIQNLSNNQKAADSFFRSTIPNLSGAVLSGGKQDGKYYNFQYISQTVPLTITQVIANKVDSDNQFQLVEATQSINGPVQGGSLTSITKSYGIESLSKALENLDWD